MPPKPLQNSDILNPELLDPEFGELVFTNMSWSRLDCYDWCNRQYKLRYCEKHADGWTAPLAGGSIFHDTMEAVVKYGVTDETEMLGFFLDAADKHDPEGKLTDEEVAAVRGMVTEMLALFVDPATEIDAANIIDVEWGFRYIIGRAIFTGFIDVTALDQDELGEFIHIIDYKTGNNYDKKGKKKKQTRTHGQMALYTLAAKRRFPGMRVKASLCWTRHNNEMDTHEFTDAELEKFVRDTATKVNRIIEDESFDIAKAPIKCCYCSFATNELCKYGAGAAARMNRMRTRNNEKRAKAS